MKKDRIGHKLIKERADREAAPRQLSPHVISRWYRPPEIILLEKNYDGAADMWGIGCVLYEMISCTYSSKSLDDRFPFQG